MEASLEITLAGGQIATRIVNFHQGQPTNAMGNCLIVPGPQ